MLTLPRGVDYGTNEFVIKAFLKYRLVDRKLAGF